MIYEFPHPTLPRNTDGGLRNGPHPTLPRCMREYASERATEEVTGRMPVLREMGGLRKRNNP